MGLRLSFPLLAIFLFAAAAFPQHAEKDADEKNPAIGDPVAIAAGQKLFMTSCAGCHGDKAQGGRGPNLRERGAWHPLGDDQMFVIIQKGVPGADMPPTPLEDGKIWQLVAFVRSLTAPAFENFVPGDPAAGKKIFWGDAGCGNCHRIDGKGGMLGPDLSNAGALHPAEVLRESIVNPNADGAPTYRSVEVVLRDGKSLRGVARNRTNYSIQLQDAKGQLHLLTADEMESVTLSRNSPMPADYAKRLSPEQITDLVAYLARQSVRPIEKNKKEKK